MVDGIYSDITEDISDHYLVWVVFGLIFDDMFVFLMMGLIFMIVGLVNKDKWKKNHKTWKQLSKSERKLKGWAIAIGVVLLVAGLVAYLLVRNGVIG